MEFEAAYSQTYFYLSIIFMVASVVATMGLMIVGSLVSDRKTHRRWLYAISFVGIISAFVGSGFLINSTDPNALETNLKKKYEISSLVKDSKSYPVKVKSEQKNPVLVKLDDGTEAVFDLTQDFTTHEPTLHTLASEEVNIANVEDIQK